MNVRKRLLPALLASFLVVSSGLIPGAAGAQTKTPFDDGTTKIDRSQTTPGSGNGSFAAPQSDLKTTPLPPDPSIQNSSKLTPPPLNYPLEPTSKSVTTYSPQFRGWLKEAHSFIDDWNFPEGVVNKYGQTITRDDFLKAIIWIESNGVHKNSKGKITTSCVGAQGFMQLMPTTVKGLGYKASDPRQNLLAGTKYIKELFTCDGVTNATTPTEKLIKACCAYNAGPYSNFVKRSWDQLKMGKNYETIGYGVKLKMCLGLELTETEKNLVPKVLDCKKSQVESLTNEFYSNANGLF
ncbi:MAG: lytic transglycosylase domain-containing protein [Candidatus Ozemobacteraceae bacterium]